MQTTNSFRQDEWDVAAKKFKHSITFYKTAFRDFVRSKPKSEVHKPVYNITWSHDQEKILTFIASILDDPGYSEKPAENLVIFGESGSGKSLVVKQIRYLFHIHCRNAIFTTNCGQLASVLNYSTLHSAFGLTKDSCKKGMALPTIIFLSQKGSSIQVKTIRFFGRGRI
jgi:hypothetical protein